MEMFVWGIDRDINHSHVPPYNVSMNAEGHVISGNVSISCGQKKKKKKKHKIHDE